VLRSCRCSSAVIGVLVVVVLASGVPAGDAAQAIPGGYRPPVTGPVVSPFDLPAEAWMPGNRGVDYDPPRGTPVVAAADGEVVFAGAVGGSLHVTVRHADGLRTSYSFLAEVSVRVGARVRGGDQVGVAGGAVHFGVRDPTNRYLDPQLLLAGTLAPTPVLVPGSGEGMDPLAERRSLLGVLAGTGSAAATWARDTTVDAVVDLSTRLYGVTVVVGHLLDALRECTPGDVAVPAPSERRIVVLVSGLGTDSGGNSAFELPTGELGYAPADVVRFSYAGGRSPDPAALQSSSAGDLAGMEQRPFTGTDSQQDLLVSADRLAALVQDVAAREPGVPIDVIAHSQGGVVSRLALDEAAEEGRLPPSVSSLVTLGSPHAGAPAADIVAGLQASRGGRQVVSGVIEWGDLAPLDPDEPAPRQLGRSSRVLAEVRDRPLPEQVHFVSIGARWDLVVPGGQTADAAAHQVMVNPAGPNADAHSALTTSPEALREVRLAVAGLPPSCQGVVDAIVDRLASQGISGLEQGLGAGAWTAALVDAGVVSPAQAPMVVDALNGVGSANRGGLAAGPQRP